MLQFSSNGCDMLVKTEIRHRGECSRNPYCISEVDCVVYQVPVAVRSWEVGQGLILLMPIQSHSVFSMLSLRRLADIQWLIAVTQRSRAATDRRVSFVLQLRYG